METAVPVGVFVWLTCWLCDLLAALAPSLSLVFLIIKLLVLILGVVTIGRLIFSQNLLFRRVS